MLYYNLEWVYKARGIENPHKFLLDNGFSIRYAQKLSKGIVKDIKVHYLEKICEVFHCTPHDIMYWQPDKKLVSNQDHPLSFLKKSNKPADILTEIRNMPLEEIQALQEYIDTNRKSQGNSPSDQTP